MLWAENRRSVNHRYAEQEWEEPYVFTELRHHSIDPVMVLKAVACYEYQSCETPGWEKSEAHAFCQSLKERCIRRLPGFDDAPWEIGDPDIFAATGVKKGAR
jgi:hypothetical protein